VRSMRRFYAFLQSLHCREDDPSPRPVDIVLCTGSVNSRSTGAHERDSSVEVARDLRDRIVGSLVSTTGLRVTDLLDLRMGDLFLHSGYMMAGPVRRSRMILLSARTVGLMQWFLEHSRPALLTGRASTYVFPSGFLRSRADDLLSTPSVRRR
jgi:site-specific recombinase XerD